MPVPVLGFRFSAGPNSWVKLLIPEAPKEALACLFRNVCCLDFAAAATSRPLNSWLYFNVLPWYCLLFGIMLA